MGCFHPLTAWRKDGAKNGSKWPLTFNFRDGLPHTELKVPCGRCIGCRLERSRQWAVRCVHEASLWQNNYFLTLTYNDDQIPMNASLVPEHYTLFMKRFRKEYGDGIRFFMCGEYGSLSARPHYHAIIFNCEFNDKSLFTLSHGLPIYRSASLEALWPFGYSSLGAVTFESCAYVARYVLKKVNGDLQEEHYNGRYPDYCRMSRRPGIASGWFDKYSGDVFPNDYVVIRDNFICRPPRYYDRLYELHHDMTDIKSARLSRLEAHAEEFTEARLSVKEELAILKQKKLDEFQKM